MPNSTLTQVLQCKKSYFLMHDIPARPVLAQPRASPASAAPERTTILSILTTSWSRTVFDDVSVYVTGYGDFDDRSNHGVFAGVTILPLGGDMTGLGQRLAQPATAPASTPA